MYAMLSVKYHGEGNGIMKNIEMIYHCSIMGNMSRNAFNPYICIIHGICM